MRHYAYSLRISVLAALLTVSTPALAQRVFDGNQTGTPPFGTFHGSNFDLVSVQNGNLHVEIPIVSVKQRGRDFALRYIYDTPTWEIVYNPNTDPRLQGFWDVQPAGNADGGWRLTSPLTWSLGYAATNYTCPIFGSPSYVLWSDFAVWDPDGTKHPLPLRKENPPTCYGSTLIGPTLDGTGISVDFTNSSAPKIILKDGTQVSATWRDPNGNLAGATDMLGRTLLTTYNAPSITYTSPLGRTGSWPAYTTWTVTDSGGNSQVYRLDYTAVDNQTSFCGSPIVGTCYELSGLDILPLKLTLPSGKLYLFTWLNNANLELNRIDLPTGGYITYAYDTLKTRPPAAGRYDTWSARRRVITRTLNGASPTATWSYAYSSGSTTVTDSMAPSNDEVHFYNYITVNSVSSDSRYETQVKTYQGSSSTGTLQRTVTKDYTGEQAPGLPEGSTIRLANVRLNRETTTLETGQQTKAETDYETFTYTSLGTSYAATRLNPTERREYDYGPLAPGALIRRTDYAYLHAGNSTYLNLNIVDRPTSVIIMDSTGATSAQTQFEYDNYTQAIQASGAVQHDSNFGAAYLTRGNVTATKRWRNTDGAWLTTRNQYDDAGNILSTTDPKGFTTSYSFADSWGNATCVPTGGNAAAYSTTTTDPLTHTFKATYNSCSGTIASATDVNNRTTTVTYDSMNRVTSVSAPDGGLITTNYNDVPPVTVTTTKKITSAMNLTSVSLLDGLGRVIQTRLTSDPDCPSGDKTDTTYDAVGRIHSVSNPYCSTSDATYGVTGYAYEALGRTIQVTHPDNSTILTTYTGRATQVQDEGNGTQRVARISQADGLGRVASVCEVSTTSLIGAGGTPAACNLDIAGTGFLTTYQYDALDNLLQVNQGGINPRTFSYDSLSRLTQATNPESGATTYTYDANGNVVSKTDARGITTCFGDWNGTTSTCNGSTGYDALNRVLKKTYSDGTPAVTFNYDETSARSIALTNTKGRRSSESTAGSFPTGLVFSYDSMGRIADNSQCTPQNCGTGVFGLQYTQYDFLGDLLSATNAAGVTFTYSYNGVARLTGISTNFIDSSHPGTLFSNAAYNAPGLLTSARLGNNLTETRAYNPRLWLTSLTAGSAYSLNMTSYAPNGDVIAANDGVNGNWTYAYDPFNRLLTANATGQPYSYDYDRFGNRWHQNGSYSSQLGFDANNRITGVTGIGYDASGDLTSDGSGPGSHTYFYDAENRIIQVDGPLGNCSLATACYVYDAEGRRVRKTTASGILDFLYDKDGLKVAEVAAGGVFMRGELYANGRHFAVYAPEPGPSGATFFTHGDWLGTERVRTDMTGAACETITSLPFGDGQVITGTCNNSSGDVSPMHFTGKERDSESGLDNFGARYNSSAIGRFMSPDPLAGHVEDPQTLNRYTYVRNNPLNLTDPTGLDFWLVGGDQCGKNGVTCDKKGFVTDDKGNRVLVGNDQLRDPNSGDTANFDKSGVHITTAQGTFAGQFAAGTDATRIEGAGDFAGLHTVFNSDCGGTCQAGGALFGTKAQFESLLPKLLKNPGLDFADPFHPGTEQYRGGNKEGPDAHLSFKASDDPNQSDPFHIDNRYSYGSVGGLAEHTGGVFKTIWNSVTGKRGPPLPKDIPIASVPQRTQQ